MNIEDTIILLGGLSVLLLVLSIGAGIGDMIAERRRRREAIDRRIHYIRRVG